MSSNVIDVGDKVCVLTGQRVGQTGEAVSVNWHSSQRGSYAMVRVMFDGGADFGWYNMKGLEKVN